MRPNFALWTAGLLLAALSGCAPPAPPKPAAPEKVARPVRPAAPGPAISTGPNCLQPAPRPPADAQRATVRRVIDGDTIELSDATRVRLLGINTPESVDPRRPVQAYGKEAAEFTRQLLDGQRILLERGRQPYDKYHRLLAWLWLPDGRFVNALLVQQGYAQVYTFADNPDHAELLLACQREARTQNRGLWHLPEYENGAEAARMGR